MHLRILCRYLYIIPLLALAGCAELDAQRTQLAEQDRTIKKLRDENRQFQDAYYKIKDQLDSQGGQSQRDIDRLTKDLDQARSTRTQKEKELGDQLRTRNMEFEALKRETLDQRVQADSRLAQLQTAITSATAQRDDAQTRQRDAEAKMRTEQARAADLVQQVTQFKVDAKTLNDQLADLQKTLTERDAALKAEKDARQSAEKQLADARQQLDAQAKQIEGAQAQAGEFRKQLDAANKAQSGTDQLRKEVERLKAENKHLAEEAGTARNRFDQELKAAKTAKAAPADDPDLQRQAAELEKRLKNLSGKGVQVRQDGRRVRLIVPNNLLFDDNKATLSDRAASVLNPIAHALRQTGDRPIHVEGHTDNQAPAPPYADNWRLGFARADSVREYLMRDGDVDASRLTALSRAQFEPLASNDSSDGRRQNRRVEIVIGSK
jgi:chemotaxis protein MotB